MRLTLQGLRDPDYVARGYALPAFDVAAVRARTRRAPQWLHLGAGNLLRVFPAVLCQRLLDAGELDTGIVVAEGFDEEILARAYAPYDDLSLAVTLRGDGRMEKRVVASVCEVVGFSDGWARLREIAACDSLRMISLAITEKGYALLDARGEPLPYAAGDFVRMDVPATLMGKLARLLYERYRAGQKPLAVVSLDNCSRNGELLQNAVTTLANAWVENGLCEQGFADYLRDEGRMTFPWSMIDKITPRPSEQTAQALRADGFEDTAIAVTARHTYCAAFVNAEECQYLAIEDAFPAGRPPLEKVGVIMTDRAAVEGIERMKVCTCLNPLHTALAVFGCLLRSPTIAAEMGDEPLRRLVYRLGYHEGLPVAEPTPALPARAFLRETLEKRLPNPFLPDTPQRIACDTSKKLPIRFGETLRAYWRAGKTELRFLTAIPLVFAAYARYLTGVADDGAAFEPSPDPNLNRLQAMLGGFRLGEPFPAECLQPLLSDAALFGVDLYEVGLAGKVCDLFARMNVGPGAVRRTLIEALDEADRA